MAYLEVLRGQQDLGRRFPMNHGEWVVGRDPGDAFQLRDQRVSRHHFRISRPTGTPTFTLINQPSGSDTYVRGNLIEGATSLRHGDQILVGDTLIVFRDEADPGADPEVDPADSALKDRSQRQRKTIEE